MTKERLDFVQSNKKSTSAIDLFYENNLKEIVKFGSSSTSASTNSLPSSRSSSPIQKSRTNQNKDYDSTTTASDSEEEFESIPTKENFLKYQNDCLQSNPVTSDTAMVSSNGGVILVKNSDINNAEQSRIGTVAVQNSTDITFGNKTFYQGPVTIKQFLLDEKNSKWIKRTGQECDDEFPENGILNNGFRGSQPSALSTIENGISSTPGKTNNNTNSNAVEQTQSDQYFNIKNHQFSKKSFVLMMVTILCALFGIILLLVFAIYGNRINSVVKTGDGDDSRKNIAINSTIGTDMLTGKVLRLISRDEWLAQPPNEILTPLILPAKRIIITHTATEFCETQAACTLRARLMQTFHMESKGWDDIGYNFMIGGDGAVYEGRGWDSQGAHTKGYNVGSIGVAYIGTFNKKLPNDKMINVGFLLYQEGVKLGKLIPDYKIYGHRQLIASESPGAAFYDLIKTWSHWTDKIPE